MLLLAVLACLAVTATSQCPPSDDISPCECSQDPLGRYTMECYGIESIPQLQSIFQASFPDKTFYNLYITESPELTSMEDVFNGVTFVIVELYKSGIKSIDSGAFTSSIDTLEQLIVKDTVLESNFIDFSSFGNYSRLSVLNIQDSSIDSITALSSNTIEYFGMISSQVNSISAGKIC